MAKQEYQISKRINKNVINEILKIEQEEGLTAEAIVERAKNKDSPLHNFFEWDNSKAGHQWRLQQSRMLINEIKICVENKTISGMENVKITLEDGSIGRIYKPIFEILSNEEQRKELIMRALQSQKYWAEKYEMYTELNPIVTAIKKTEKTLLKKWQKKR